MATTSTLPGELLIGMTLASCFTVSPLVIYSTLYRVPVWLFHIIPMPITICLNHLALGIDFRSLLMDVPHFRRRHQEYRTSVRETATFNYPLGWNTCDIHFCVVGCRTSHWPGYVEDVVLSWCQRWQKGATCKTRHEGPQNYMIKGFIWHHSRSRFLTII